MDFDNISQFYRSIPPVTRVILTCFVITSVVIHFDFVRAYRIYLDFNLIFFKFQIWRLFTSFMYLGNFSIILFFNLLIFFRHSSQLELSQYYGRTADYLTMYLFCCANLLTFGFILKIPFLAHPLIETVIYIWSRKNPFALVNLLGLFTFPAPWFPYISIFLSFVTGQSIKMDLAALFTGHLYFYLEDIYPSRYNGQILLKTPRLIQKLVDYLMSNEDPEPTTNEEPNQAQWND